MSAAATVLQPWFDQLEKVLHAEAALAGLLGQGSMIGSAREFFVSRILRTILPPILHVGTGIVFSADGSRSNQLDVIIYDPRFPVFEIQRGQGLYPVEGTIATIEVKSLLTEKKLHEAFDNCLSVTRLRSATRPPSPYVFAFQAKAKRLKTFRSQTERWWTKRGFGYHDDHHMPEVIVAGPFTGITPRLYDFDGEGRKAVERGEKIKLALWQVKRPFAWLLMHLLETISTRLNYLNDSFSREYLPLEIYYAAEIERGLSSRITARAPPANSASEAK